MSEESTSLAVAREPAAVPAVFDFAPRDLGEALKLAEMLASSTMVPKDYIGKPGNCFIAMQFGHELGLKPVQSLQGIAVINGKPGIYGDAGKALLLSHGCEIIERDIAEIKTTGIAQCTVKRPGREPVTRTFSRGNAETAGLLTKDGPWRQHPERQMAWRAFWFAARDAAADILKGIPAADDLRDATIRDVTAEGSATIVSEPRATVSDPKPRETATAGPAENASTTPAADANAESPIASEGMRKAIRRAAGNAGLTAEEVCAAQQVANLDAPFTVKIGNAMLAWIEANKKDAHATP